MLELSQIESFYPEQLRPFKRNLLREYLQYKILGFIFSSQFAAGLSFMGGTAIHIVHSLPRFSEDLDFDNRGLTKADFEDLSVSLQKKLQLEGCRVEVKNSFKGAYRTAIRIPEILYLNKLSKLADEKILIQIDTEPQNFPYTPDKVILNKFDVFTGINVAPVDILLSQKLFAIFMRKRPMGRDFYDAIFLWGKTKPNFDYLQAKLQIGNLSDLKEQLLKRCENFNFQTLAKDIEQFLYIPGDAQKVLLFTEHIKSLV